MISRVVRIPVSFRARDRSRSSRTTLVRFIHQIYTTAAAPFKEAWPKTSVLPASHCLVGNADVVAVRQPA